jgi:hypothetical protein
MSTSERKIKISLTAGDDSAIKRLEQMNREIEQARQASEDAAKAQTLLAQNAQRAGGAFDGASTALLSRLGDVRTEIQGISSDYEEFIDSIRRSAIEAERLAEEQREARRMRPSRGQFDVGGAGTGASQLAGLASNFSPELGGALSVAGDLGDAGEALQNLPNVLSGIPAAINPISAAVIAFGAASALAVNQIVQGSAQLSKEIAAGINAGADLDRQIAAGLTSEQANAEIERTIKLRAAELEIVERENARRDEAIRAAERSGILGQAALALFNANNEAEQANADVLAQATANAEGYTAKIQALRGATLDGSLATNDAAAAELELARIREQEANALAGGLRSALTAITDGAGTEELNRQIQEATAARNIELEVQRQLRAAGQENTEIYRQSVAAVDQYNTQLSVLNSAQVQSAARTNDAAIAFEKSARAGEEITKTLAQFEQQAKSAAAAQSLANSDRAVDAANREADRANDLRRQQEAAEATHKQNLLAIQQRGNAQIEQLNKQLADRITSSNNAIAAAEEKYRVSELKAQADYQRRRAALIQDSEDQLFEAALSGDLSRVSLIQRQRDRGLAELDTNEKIRADEAKAQLDERVNTLKAETEAYKTEIATRITETQKAVQADIDGAKKAFDEKLKADEDLRNIQRQREERDAQIRADREARDLALREAAEQRATAEQLKLIDDERAAKAAANLESQAAINALEAAAIRVKGIAQTIGQGVTNPFSNLLSGIQNPFNSIAQPPQLSPPTSTYVDPYVGSGLPPLSGLDGGLTKSIPNGFGDATRGMIPQSRIPEFIAPLSRGAGAGSGGQMDIVLKGGFKVTVDGNSLSPEAQRELASGIESKVYSTVQEALVYIGENRKW